MTFEKWLLVALFFVTAETIVSIGRSWWMFWYQRYKNSRCKECGGDASKAQQRLMLLPTCDDCMAKHPAIPVEGPFAPGSEYLIAGQRPADILKELYTDERTMKAMRKAMGLETERERFEEEANEPENFNTSPLV